MTVINVLDTKKNLPPYNPAKNNGATFFNALRKHGVPEEQIQIVNDIVNGYGKMSAKEVAALVYATYGFRIEINSA